MGVPVQQHAEDQRFPSPDLTWETPPNFSLRWYSRDTKVTPQQELFPAQPTCQWYLPRNISNILYLWAFPLPHVGNHVDFLLGDHEISVGRRQCCLLGGFWKEKEFKPFGLWRCCYVLNCEFLSKENIFRPLLKSTYLSYWLPMWSMIKIQYSGQIKESTFQLWNSPPQ